MFGWLKQQPQRFFGGWDPKNTHWTMAGDLECDYGKPTLWASGAWDGSQGVMTIVWSMLVDDHSMIYQFWWSLQLRVMVSWWLLHICCTNHCPNSLWQSVTFFRSFYAGPQRLHFRKARESKCPARALRVVDHPCVMVLWIHCYDNEIM